MSIAIGRRDIDIRYDPLNGALVPQEILGSDGIGNGEFHQNLPIDGLPGRFGFSPNEMPQRRTDIADSGIVVYEVDSSNNLTGFSALGDPLVQVRPPIGGQPGVGEYAVDFNNPINFLNTGRFFFNPSDANKYYRIHRYFGLGSLNSVRNTFFIEQTALALKLSRDGSLPMTGNLNFGSNKAVNLANGTAGSDAVNLNQLNTRVAKSGDTMTGNLTIPNGTAGGHAVNLNQLNAATNAQPLKGFSSVFADTNQTVNATADAYVYETSHNPNSEVNIIGCPNTLGTSIIVSSRGGNGNSRVRIHGQIIYQNWSEGVDQIGLWVKVTRFPGFTETWVQV